MQTKEYLIIKRPGFLVSVIEDAVTFTGFIIVLWFNHRYLDGSSFIDFLFIILWIAMIAGRHSNQYKRFSGYKEAIKYLESKENE